MDDCLYDRNLTVTLPVRDWLTLRLALYTSIERDQSLGFVSTAEMTRRVKDRVEKQTDAPIAAAGMEAKGTLA